uniref:Helitron_like_N domain-containing protein n=1 Tax=Steinernema glaseri TaxID=37863 RepID=A0A1I7Y9Z9_9BILA
MQCNPQPGCSNKCEALEILVNDKIVNAIVDPTTNISICHTVMANRLHAQKLRSRVTRGLTSDGSVLIFNGNSDQDVEKAPGILLYQHAIRICTGKCQFLGRRHTQKEKLRHYLEFHDRYIACSNGNIYTPNTSLSVELYTAKPDVFKKDPSITADDFTRVLQTLLKKQSIDKRNRYVYLLLDEVHLKCGSTKRYGK